MASNQGGQEGRIAIVVDSLSSHGIFVKLRFSRNSSFLVSHSPDRGEVNDLTGWAEDDIEGRQWRV